MSSSSAPPPKVANLFGYPFKKEDYDTVKVFYTGAFGGLTGPINKDGIYTATEFVKRIEPFFMKLNFPNPQDELQGSAVTSSFDLWDWLHFSGGKIYSF
jgi:hypothetical protein